MLVQLWACAFVPWLIHIALGAGLSYYAAALSIQTKVHHKGKGCPCPNLQNSHSVGHWDTEFDVHFSRILLFAVVSAHWDELGK